MRPLLHLAPLRLSQVEVTAGLWKDKQIVNHAATIPHCFDMLEQVGTIGNFRLAATGKLECFRGFLFADSDLYKTIEAASFDFANTRDAASADIIEGFARLIASAQMQDGYLNTYYQVKEGIAKRFSNLTNNHELYCAGHLFEAAVAHFEATGSKSLLNVAIRLADLLVDNFGEGKVAGYPGHPETELALVKLFRATGDDRYFDLARLFVERRGSHYFATESWRKEAKYEESWRAGAEYDGTYWQDDVPIREHVNIKGHAVRAAYLMSGVLDVASRTGDQALLQMVDRVWRNTVEKRMYITGGIGSSAKNEGFTADYDLPNLDAYQETCASIAMVLWAHRLALLYGDAQYADAMEHSLYNAVLSGVSEDGRRFFYANALESRGDKERPPWYDCACCPPNIARLIASIGEYAYAVSEDGLWVNLYIDSHASFDRNGKVAFRVKTDYPWSGQVRLEIESAPSEPFSIKLRIPGWAEVGEGNDGEIGSVRMGGREHLRPVTRHPSPVTLEVNGEKMGIDLERGYAVSSRVWKAGDFVELDLPMPMRKLASNPKVFDNAGRVAIARGPVIYCFEGVGQELAGLHIPFDADFEAVRQGGQMNLKGSVLREEAWENGLYGPPRTFQPTSVEAVPYFTWANRGPAPMSVWVPLV